MIKIWLKYHQVANCNNGWVHTGVKIQDHCKTWFLISPNAWTVYQHNFVADLDEWVRCDFKVFSLGWKIWRDIIKTELSNFGGHFGFFGKNALKFFSVSDHSRKIWQYLVQCLLIDVSHCFLWNVNWNIFITSNLMF